MDGQIAGDGKDIYWADLTSSSTGKLLRVSEADGTTDTLVSGPPVSRVAVDSAAIYWLEANHAASTGPYSIRKLAK